MAHLVMNDELDRILTTGGVRSLYQPIVALDTGHVVGFEALARGPQGSDLETPDRLFASARAAHRVDELDGVCREAALRGALEAGMTNATSLFVNIEPSAVTAPPTAAILAIEREASVTLDVVVEVTERSLVDAPADLLTMLERVRELGFGIALDDVGAEIASLALMPFLRPEVIKLDLRLTQDRPDREIAAIVAAVNAECERSGAVVLAEGIETEEHLRIALAMGATLGQGWLLGRPAPLPGGLARLGQVAGAVARRAAKARPVATLGHAGDGGPAVRRSTKPLLLEMSWHLERQALDLGAPAVVLSTFQTADRFTPATRVRYAELAAQAAFVGVFGVGIGPEPAPGVRGGDIDPGDPLVDIWAAVVVGPHFAAALVATDLHDDGADAERRFDYRLTYDRKRAMAVAMLLMTRISHRVPVST